MPSTVNGIVDKFVLEKFVISTELGFGVTQLGAILLAKNFRDFDNLYRKAVRVIVYRGKNKIDTIREQSFEQGYAVQFVQMLDWINGQLPANEEIGRALRKDVRMYPEKAIREIVANMIINQNFAVQGFLRVEIYSDRVEIPRPINRSSAQTALLTNINRAMMSWLTLCDEWDFARRKEVAWIKRWQVLKNIS